MSLVKSVVGLPQVRGNNEVTYYISNYQYKQENEGTTYIPEGCFIMFSGTGNNAILSDGGSVIGISGHCDYNVLVENVTLPNNNCNQTYHKETMNIAVQFLDDDIGNGVTGDPVYVADDGSGKATLSKTDEEPVGFLMSAVLNSYYDSRNNLVTGAFINFNGARAVSGGVVPAPAKFNNK